MELSALLQVTRELLDDAGGFVHSSDDKLVRLLNNAVREAALRTRALQDDTSDACRVELVVGQARYTLDPKILVVRAAHVPNRKQPLVLTKASRLDCLVPGWSHQTQQNATPKYAVFDTEQKVMVLHPPPAEVGTMHLRVWRLPFESEEFEPADTDSEPVLLLPDPESLKHWVGYEVYNEKDSELYDSDRAKYHYGIFEATFGKRPTNHELQLWSTSRIVGQRMHSEF